jgi:hypothetical protein
MSGAEFDAERDMDLDELPCGCVIGTADVGGQRAFIMKPCGPDCEYYQYALSQAERQGKPISQVMLGNEN